MNLSIFNPINRKTYLIGIVVIWVISWGLQLINKGGVTPSDSFIKAMFVMSLFFAIVKIIWDYKRIKDISIKKFYLLLLLPEIILIIGTTFFSGTNNNMLSVTGFINGESSEITIILVMLSILIINSGCKLFLIFKNGYAKNVSVIK